MGYTLKSVLNKSSDVFLMDIDNSGKSLEDFQGVEATLLKEQSCTQQHPDLIALNISKFIQADIEKLDMFLNDENTFVVDLHRDIACMLDLLINGVPANIELIHTFFTGLKVVSNNSAEGVGVLPLIDTHSPVFAKVPKPNTKDNLVHEAFVGIFCTNLLRSIVPNFAYVYGYTKCSPPIIENDTVNNWCQTKDKELSTYLFMENVKNAVPLSTFIKQSSTTLVNVKHIILQITQALKSGWEQFSYQHNDLHGNNVLVRIFDQEQTFPYYDRNIGITTKCIPYIIDYGHSSFLFQGYEMKNVFLEHSTPVHPLADIYKIICFAAESLLLDNKQNGDIYKWLSTLFEIFNEGPLFNLNTTAFVYENGGNRRQNYYVINAATGGTFEEFSAYLVSLCHDIDTVHIEQSTVIKNGTEDFCSFYENIRAAIYELDNEKYVILINSILQDVHLSEAEKNNQIDNINKTYSPHDKFVSDYPAYTRVLKSIGNVITELQSSMVQLNSSNPDPALQGFRVIRVADLQYPVLSHTYAYNLNRIANLQTIMYRLNLSLSGDIAALTMNTSNSDFTQINILIGRWNEYKHELSRLGKLISSNLQVLQNINLSTNLSGNSSRDISEVWIDLANSVIENM